MKRQKTDIVKRESTSEVKKSSIKPYKKRFTKVKKSFFKHAFVFANVVIIVGVVAIVWAGNSQSQTENARSILSKSSDQTTSALDQISAADIAANIALSTSMPEAVAVSNQADSANAQVLSATVEETVVNKPQLVAGGATNKNDIQTYTTVAGDTVSSLATRFGISSDTIKWSNSLTSDTLQAGKKLQIPPRNGVVYKVLATDTVDSIASRYSASKDQIITFNDLELNALNAGETIFIPNGTQPVVTRTAAANTSFTVYGFSPLYGSNGYTPGYCTYYVASRIAVPKNWGNANTWAAYAAVSGWTVSRTPVIGAIAQRGGGLGHVAIVEAVSDDGTMIKYSDMNGLAGFGRVGYSDWVSASVYSSYIYH